MPQPSRRPYSDHRSSDRRYADRDRSFRSRSRRLSAGRPRASWIVGVGLPAAVAVGALLVYTGLSSSTVASGPSAGQTVLLAANGVPAANNGGQAPVSQAQNGLMLDPRGKRKAAEAARQAAAAAKANGTATPAQAAVPNPNCTLIVPANPLTAAGLATPYQLTATNPKAGPCNEANVNQSAFVQAAIISPAGQITLYDPLVIDMGTTALAPPAAVPFPAGSTVGIWFGFNGTNLTLQAAAGTNSLVQGLCVNGLPNSIFGQFAACNGPGFFVAANAAVAAGALVVPPLGTALDGKPCPSVRSFDLVDQDQSDNVTSHILAAPNGQTGQNNAATRAAIANLGAAPVDLANGSDNRLLSVFVQPALGCQVFTLPNASNDNNPTPSLPLNELQAAGFQQAPIALVPLTDPMTMVNMNQSATKTNLFRVAVNQNPIGAADNGNGTTYCMNLFQNPAGIQRIFNPQTMALLQNGPSPDVAAATNLFTFLANRGNQSFTNLNCMNLLNIPNPIVLTVNGNNVVTAATFTPPAAAANNAANGMMATNGMTANGMTTNGMTTNGMTTNGMTANGMTTALNQATTAGGTTAAPVATPAAAVPAATGTTKKKHKH